MVFLCRILLTSEPLAHNLNQIRFVSTASSLLTPDSNHHKKIWHILSLLRTEKNPDRILKICRSASLTPDHHHLHRGAFSIAVATLSSSKHFFAVSHLLDGFIKSQTYPRPESLAVLYARANMLDQSLQTFHNLERYDIQRTVKSLNALLLACLELENLSITILLMLCSTVLNLFCDGDESLRRPLKFPSMLMDFKAQAEALIKFANNRDGLLTCDLRSSIVFGPGDMEFVPFLVNLAKSGYAKGIEKLRKCGETVKVAPGYFRNHIMPKLLAVPNIDKYAHLIREQRKMRNFVEKEEVKVVHKTSEVQIKEFEKAAKRLANANLVLRKLIIKEKFKNRSSKEDKPDVQTPVTKEDIVSKVARQLCVKI
ncbi:hypothetical protein Bca4012_037903 [Brassica carinata]